MGIFKNSIRFDAHDPLDDGLRDAIMAEQREVDAFHTLNDPSGDELVEQWDAIVKDIEKDPSWFSFNED